MNAVGRLWVALAAGDDRCAVDELHPHVVAVWPHTGQRFATPAAYVAAHELLRGSGAVDVSRVITQGRAVAVEVAITGGEREWVGAGIYHLHDGRVRRIVEYWLPPAPRC